ncbi:SURF1 family protein [Kitasatospora sp. NPDC096147]|uniref:SURF1 family protein n=1 Tax=Kitasatospora sp. NPDC096147 TaxID=3364093 RepID=UPI0037FD3A2F
MYRFLLTSRWLGGTAVAVLAVVVCVLMGSWQLSRFEDQVDRHEDAARTATAGSTGPAVPLADLLPGPGAKVTTETVGRSVTVTGRYDREHQLLVPNRTVDGRQGHYVLTPLCPAGADGADGASGADPACVPVVRGWAPGTPAEPPALPEGTVTVAGRLQAPENSGSDGAVTGGLPAGQLGTISPASLVNVLPYPTTDGWLAADTVPAGLAPVPTVQPQGGNGLSLRAFQNLGYTLEWFVFGGFVVFMWFRLARREAERARDRALGLDPVLD